MLLAKYNANKVPTSVQELVGSLKKMTGGDILKVLVPYFAPMLVNVPLAVKGIQLKKDAGKLGVMMSMEDMQDERLFLAEKSAELN